MAVFLFTSCREKKSPPSPTHSLTKGVLTSSVGGKKSWRLSSERTEIKNKKTYLYNVKFELFKQGEIGCVITGDKGEITPLKITLSGNIIATTKEGGTLTTNSLNFEEKNHSLSTDDPVCFIKEHLVLKGKGFIANRDLSNIIIKKHVEVFWEN